MNRQDYLNECYRQLNNQHFYEKVNEDPTESITKRVRFYLKRLYSDDVIDTDTYHYLLPQDPKAGRFYILPKIHKAGNPGRPIVSSNGHPTERISEFVSFHLNPLVQSLPSYVKNTTHLLNILKEIDVLPTNAIIVALDVSSLYTNIPTNEGINACRIALDKQTDKSVPTESICDLTRMILTMNNFVFNNEHFIEGPEGVKWELGLACFCPGKMGFRSLGLGFGHWEWEKKCQKWEWDKYFVTMTS